MSLSPEYPAELRAVLACTVEGGSPQHVAVRADTVCLHGDQPRAAAVARRLRAELERADVTVRAL